MWGQGRASGGLVKFRHPANIELEVDSLGARRCITCFLPTRGLKSHRRGRPQTRVPAPTFPDCVSLSKALTLSGSQGRSRSKWPSEESFWSCHSQAGRSLWPSTLCVPDPFRTDQDTGPELAETSGWGSPGLPRRLVLLGEGLLARPRQGRAVPRGTVGTDRRDRYLKGRGRKEGRKRCPGWNGSRGCPSCTCQRLPN